MAATVAATGINDNNEILKNIFMDLTLPWQTLVEAYRRHAVLCQAGDCSALWLFQSVDALCAYTAS